MAPTLGTFDTIGHHTFEDRQNDCAAKAPFYCKNAGAFLGHGYYFWDDNLAVAKYWGGLHYINHQKQYFVGEYLLQCDREIFFDLVGDRKHQKMLLHVINGIARRKPEKGNWPIGRVIEFLKASSKDPESPYKDKFPYKLIRAAAHDLGKNDVKVPFSDRSPSTASLNPCYIICAIDKISIVLGPILVAHTSRK